MAHCLGYYDEELGLLHERASKFVSGHEQLNQASKMKSLKVKNMIHQTLPQLFVEDVFEIKSTYLEKLYLLKKEEYNVRYGNVKELLLFHATSAANVDSIRTNNFDWRKVKRGKFGKGTSFSDSAKYANCQANRAIGVDRAFILTKVLVAKKVQGRPSMKVPPAKYDTTIGNNTVFVKFNDNEVLPQYVVFYNSNDILLKKSWQRKHEDIDSFYGDGKDYGNFDYDGFIFDDY